MCVYVFWTFYQKYQQCEIQGTDERMNERAKHNECRKGKDENIFAPICRTPRRNITPNTTAHYIANNKFSSAHHRLLFCHFFSIYSSLYLFLVDRYIDISFACIRLMIVSFYTTYELRAFILYELHLLESSRMKATNFQTDIDRRSSECVTDS